MRELMSSTINDPTHDVTMTQRGLHFLFASMICALLCFACGVVLLSHTLEPAHFIFLGIVTAIFLVATIACWQAFVSKERKFVNGVQEKVEATIIEELGKVGANIDIEIKEWMTNEIVKSFGANIAHPVCLIEENTVYVLNLHDKENQVEVKLYKSEIENHNENVD